MYAESVTLSQAEKQALLAEISFFGDMDSGVLGSLTAVVHTTTLSTRKELFHKGDAASAIYVLASGRLKIVTTSELGEDLVLNVINPGGVIGEIALFAATERSATVIALEWNTATMCINLQTDNVVKFRNAALVVG